MDAVKDSIVQLTGGRGEVSENLVAERSKMEEPFMEWVNGDKDLPFSEKKSVKLLDGSDIDLSLAHAQAHESMMCVKIVPHQSPPVWNLSYWDYTNTPEETRLGLHPVLERVQPWFTIKNRVVPPLLAAPAHVGTSINFSTCTGHFKIDDDMYERIIEENKRIGYDEEGAQRRRKREFNVPNWPVLHTAEFTDVFLNTEGWVVQPQQCRAVRVGGCLRYNAWKNPNKWVFHQEAGATGKRVFTTNKQLSTWSLYVSNRIFNDVFSIAQTAATWHFTMEALVGLASIDTDSILYDPDNNDRGKGTQEKPVVLHVAKLDGYIVQWLRLVFGVDPIFCFPKDQDDIGKCAHGANNTTIRHPSVNVVTGSVIAKRATVPEMPECGIPSIQHINWIRQRVNAYLDARPFLAVGYTEPKGVVHAAVAAAATAATDISPPVWAGGVGGRVRMGQLHGMTGRWAIPSFRDSKLNSLFKTIKGMEAKGKEINLIVLIDRTKTRTLSNSDIIRRDVREYASKHDYLFYEHSDRNEPTLEDQLRLHRYATMLVGPHGAAEVDMISMRHNTCLVEIQRNDRSVWCYARSAMAMGMHFFSVPTTVIGQTNITVRGNGVNPKRTTRVKNLIGADMTDLAKSMEMCILKRNGGKKQKNNDNNILQARM